MNSDKEAIANRVLIIDDDINFANSLSEVVTRRGFIVDVVNSYEEGEVQLKKNCHDLVIVDLILPDGDGMSLVHSTADDHQAEFYVVTGHPSVETAVDALKDRAVDYLVKPVTSKKVHKLLNRFKLDQIKNMDSNENSKSIPTVDKKVEFIGKSPQIITLLRDIEKLAPTSASVFIQGESGTGKEIIAHLIHQKSDRSGLLCAINCGAINQEIIQSELFGHEQGGFAGAEKQRAGVFEQAHNGTLFLDSITEMPMEMQVSLLRVLESGKFSRVGSHVQLDCNVRIIAATNSVPAEAVAKGKLREDLYFRLAELPIKLPALRERGDDVQHLAAHFLIRFNKDNNTNKKLDAKASLSLMQYSWPGNVRELHHVIHRAYLNCDEWLRFNDIFAELQSNSGGVGQIGSPTIAEMEQNLIMGTLSKLEGDKPKAAEALGISLKTLYNRLNQYNRPKHQMLKPPH